MCDDFQENDRQRDVYYNHRHHIFYTANASTESADGQESGVGKTLRPTPRLPSIEKGCFSLSERRRSFRCLRDPVIHPSIYPSRTSWQNTTASLDSAEQQQHHLLYYIRCRRHRCRRRVFIKEKNF